MKGIVLVATLALLVALLAACKSDSKDGGDKTPSAEETPASGETPTDGGDGGDGGNGGDSGLSDLERLASEAAGDFTGKITYQITTESGGQTTEQEWTLAQRPPDSRFEIVSNEGGQESRTIVIQTAEKSYVCTSAGGSEICFASDQTEQYTGLFDPIFDAPQSIVQDIDNLGLGDQSERDIAGVHANCFSYSLAGAESETCFSDEGLMLYLRTGSAGNSFTYEAKSASTDVTDADFEPPYPVTDIPTG
jgi:hypothetical protein